MNFREFSDWAEKHGPCDCGYPELYWDLLVDVLEHIDCHYDEKTQEWDEWVAAHIAREAEILPDKRTRYFIYYWLDNLRLTEHGGSVPGWLENSGKELLEAIKQYREDLENHFSWRLNSETNEYDIPIFKDGYVPSWERS